jgi:predicted transcriptional regulator of viral defense system
MGDSQASRTRQRLRILGPTFTAAQAREAGLGSRDLRHLADSAEIAEISRGVYRRADAPETAHLDLIAVCTRAPQAVICDESALALHELIDDIPAEVHIAVRRGTRRPATRQCESPSTRP